MPREPEGGGRLSEWDWSGSDPKGPPYAPHTPCPHKDGCETHPGGCGCSASGSALAQVRTALHWGSDCHCPTTERPRGRMLTSAPLLSPGVSTEQISKSTAPTPNPWRSNPEVRQAAPPTEKQQVSGLRTDLGLRLLGSKAGSATSSLCKQDQISRLGHASVSVKGGFPSCGCRTKHIGKLGAQRAP